MWTPLDIALLLLQGMPSQDREVVGGAGELGIHNRDVKPEVDSKSQAPHPADRVEAVGATAGQGAHHGVR